MEVRLAGSLETVFSAPGVFSSHRLDLGSSVLLRTVAGADHELPEEGDVLDLGCGWGAIALTMARLAPNCAVWAVDVNEAARQLTARNAERLGCPNIHVAAPAELPESLRFQRIWSNPPIRIGKTELHALLLTWLGRLEATGWADLVVGKNLGADSLQAWLGPDGAGFRTERLASAKGFRVLRVHAKAA
jgi:16S rRNA G1207 methylase RsmC